MEHAMILALTFLFGWALADQQPSPLCPSFPVGALGVATNDGTPLHMVSPPISHVEEIRDGLYWATDGSYILMFLVGHSGVILVDAPPSIARATPNIVGAIQNVTEKPITHLILSHYHKDHIAGGNQVVEAFPDAAVIAHEDTKGLLEEAREEDPDDPRPLVSITFKNKALVFPNGKLVIDGEVEQPKEFEGLVLTPSSFHTEGDLFIYAPAHKTLMVVDMMDPGYIPYFRFAYARDMRRYMKAHDQVLAFDFDTFNAGHVNRMATRDDVKLQKKYVLSVKKAMQDALDVVPFDSRNTDGCFNINHWKVFGDYFGRVVSNCTAAVIDEWQGKLVLEESMIRAQCDTMQVALRLE